MEQRELSKKEQALINGGSANFITSTAVNIGTDSLVSLTYSYKSGDKEGTYTLEAGKDIDINLGANLNNDAQ
ncbi:hypothetical protein ACXZ1K_15755 [Pedobacter sp. PWIIR3]